MKFLFLRIFSIFSASIHILQVFSVRIQLENLPDKCDFSKCQQPDSSKLNVHLIPHTHDDVGWLKTVDQYYYGSRNDIQNAGVQYILDTVVEELMMNKDRKFIYVETAFFWKWWLEQDEEMRSIVKELVRSGQFEFINGGWSMPDEANTHYNSLIDQSTWGLKRLNSIFGKCGRPRVTWQIDPFGHSRELASLFAQMGYDSMYFAREDYQDCDHRQLSKTLEHVWQGSDDLGSQGDLFVGMMQMNYGPPKGFNWDLVGGISEPIIDNPDSEEYNVPSIVEKFNELARNYSNYYATNHIMFPMGTDFNYQSAHNWFKNMDKLIRAVNSKGEVKTFYSTPSCYTKALWESGLTWTSKNDDYFPYASDSHSYWTGYFTSRPAIKRIERIGNNWLQACKQLDVLAGNNGLFEQNITTLREAMGVMQHHDAVAGTEKQHVANDYVKLLYNGIRQCQQVIAKSYSQLAKQFGLNFHADSTEVIFCDYLNISSCEITESGHSFVVTVYNPLAHALPNEIIRLPVNDKVYYQVYDPQGQPVSASLVPISDSVLQIPGRPYRGNSSELVFRVNLKPLGLAIYSVMASLTPTANSAKLIPGRKIQKPTKLRGKNFELLFDDQGQMVQIHLLKKNKKVHFRNNFRYYKSGVANLLINRSSGAYVFRPQNNQTYPVGRLLESILYVDDSKNLVQEVHQKFDSFIQQIVRVDPYGDEIEFEFIVGPILIHDNIGKEIIVRYETSLNNKGVFYTDSNGRQIMRRQWNYRPTWSLKLKEPISGNYYPVNSRIALHDELENLQLTILNDRSQGGTSSKNGTLELMIHRRILHDDNFGVDEALNESGVDGRGLVIRGRHLLLLETIDQSPRKHRPLAQKLFMQKILSFSKLNKQFVLSKKGFLTNTNLSIELPPNVHLLTLEKWSGDTYLLRLEHFYQRKEDPELSQSVKINLRNLFKPFIIVQAQEMTLAANQNIKALDDRLRFDYIPIATHIPDKSSAGKVIKFNGENTLEIELHAMQIKTFIVRFERSI